MFGAAPPTWPGVLTPAPVAEGQFPLFSGVRVFHRDYENPRTSTFNVGYEQEVVTDVSAYADYTYARGRHLTRFINYNRADAGSPFTPQLDEVMVTTSLGHSDYNGLTLGVRKRMSKGFQLEANYVLSRDKDDDSNERDPFTDRAFNFNDLSLDYGYSDRDIRHKFNFFGYFEAAGTRRAEHPRAGARRTADYAESARGERRRSGAQQPEKGQRILQLRLAGVAPVPPRRTGPS